MNSNDTFRYAGIALKFCFFRFWYEIDRPCPINIMDARPLAERVIVIIASAPKSYIILRVYL